MIRSLSNLLSRHTSLSFEISANMVPLKVGTDARLLRHEHFAVSRHFATSRKRSGMHAVGKLCFRILFDFDALSSKMTYLTVWLHCVGFVASADLMKTTSRIAVS